MDSDTTRIADFNARQPPLVNSYSISDPEKGLSDTKKPQPPRSDDPSIISSDADNLRSSDQHNNKNNAPPNPDNHDNPLALHASHHSSNTTFVAGPPPNGGILAWTQVLAGFAIFFNTWGHLNTFGVFQTFYEGPNSPFHQSSSNIAWIGSIHAYCLLVVGLISGPLYDRGWFRELLISGSFLVTFGFMMLSLAHDYWQVILAQGFCIGIGAGLLFVPSLAVLPAYFSTRLGLAMGLAASGSSLGGVIYPIVFYRLIDTVGFGWGVRTIGFISFATLLVPIFFMRMGAKPVKPRAVLDWGAFTDWPFVTFTLFSLVGFTGLYVMLFYVSYFSLATGIASQEMAFYLVPLLNATSMFGRTMPNWLSDTVGPMNRESSLNFLFLFAPFVYNHLDGHVHASGNCMYVLLLARH